MQYTPMHGYSPYHAAESHISTTVITITIIIITHVIRTHKDTAHAHTRMHHPLHKIFKLKLQVRDWSCQKGLTFMSQLADCKLVKN